MKYRVVVLDYADAPTVQTEAMQSLRASLGQKQGQDVIDRAALELSDRLWQLEKALYDHEFNEVKRLASSLSAISVQIGLTEFSMVASDLCKCIQQNDLISIRAVSARLIRVGEQSLHIAVGFSNNAV